MAQVNVKASRPSRSMVKHPNLQNISTTLGFGEVTSLGFVEMQANSKVKGKIKSLIRTATMPVPTFGTISYKTYARFIPTKDIYRNNENLKGELPITTQFGTFIPKNQPYINSNWLSVYLLKYCRFAIYKATGEQQADKNNQEVTLNDCEEFSSKNMSLVHPLVLKLIDDRISEGIPNYKNPLAEDNEDYSQGLNLARDEKITPQNCDFTLVRTNTDAITTKYGDWPATEGNAYIFCFRLTKKGKTLYRILTSLGWKFSLRNSEKINILPLMAYYKGYFELFEPKNTATGANVYTNTACFRLSDYICEHDVQQVIAFSQSGNHKEPMIQTILFENMLEEIAQSYYYNEPNLITAHIATPSVGTQNAELNTTWDTLRTLNTIKQKPNETPNFNGASYYLITAPSIKLLMKMYVISNKHSVIGGNLRKLIQALYGYDPETIEGIVYDCGRNSYDLDITMIPSQADTLTENGGAQLGEIGGLATGRSTEDNKGMLMYKCKADTDGYLMFYSVIVPNCSFFQGLDPRLKHGTDGKYSLYNEDFDSIGLEINTKSILLGERTNEIPQIRIDGDVIGNENRQEETAFGFIPRFMSYKMLIGDIVNGDLRRNQYKEQLRAYYLGKELSIPSVNGELNAENNKWKITLRTPNDVPITTPELRAVGKYNWLENFNKIFYNYNEEITAPLGNGLDSWEETYGYDDAFIIHNENEYDKFDHMKPTTESFETDGENSESIDVEHA